MPDASTYGLFLLASLALLLIPGPAVIYIVTRGMDQGRWAGVVSALGLGVGNLVHALAATVGLSAVLASSAIAFSIVKYAGAAYLIYLGIKRLMTKEEAVSGDGSTRSLRRIFTEGIVINILNPKVALFFLAFLPQFVNPDAGSLAWQVFVLGTSFALLGVMSDALYGLLAGTIGGWLKRRPGFARGERYVAGGVYLALGTASALTGRPTD